MVTTDQKPKQIFISYAKRDGSRFAERIHDDLEQRGFALWLDVKDIKGGTSWDDEIRKGLDASIAVLVIMTPGAVISANVAAEWNHGLDNYYPIIPLLFIDCDMPFRLKTIQYIDFRAEKVGYELSLQNLIDNLSNLIPRQLNKLHHELNKLNQYDLKHPGRYSNEGLEHALALWESYNEDPSLGIYRANADKSDQNQREETPESNIPLSKNEDPSLGTYRANADKSDQNQREETPEIEPIPHDNTSKITLKLAIKLLFVSILVSILLGILFYLLGDSFLGFGQLFAAIIFPVLGTVLATFFTKFENWLDNTISVGALTIITVILAVILLAIVRPEWTRLAILNPTKILDAPGSGSDQLGVLQPGMISPTLLGLSEDGQWYLIECVNKARDTECWVELTDKVKRLGVGWPLPIMYSNSAMLDATETAVRQFAMLETATAEAARSQQTIAAEYQATQDTIVRTGTVSVQLAQTAEAATATHGGTATALLLTVTAHGYNTATREAANSVLTATRFAEDVLATYAAAFTQTTQANEQATQTAIVLTDSQHTAVAQAQTKVAQAITQTAEAFTDTPTPVPTPMGVCSGQWQWVNSGQPDEFFICDSLVTTEKYLTVNPLVAAPPSDQSFYPEARQDLANEYCEEFAKDDPSYEYRLPNYDQWQSALTQGNIHPNPTYDREWLWSVPNNNTDSYEGMVYENGWQHRTNLPLIPNNRDWIYFRCVAVLKPG